MGAATARSPKRQSACLGGAESSPTDLTATATNNDDVLEPSSAVKEALASPQ